MKKKLLTVFMIIAVSLMAVVPVFANAPAPMPELVNLYVTHPELLVSVRMILYDDEGNDMYEETDVLGEPFEKDQSFIINEIAKSDNKGKKIQISFMNAQLRDFAFEFKLADGATVITDTVDANSTGYHKYSFDCKTYNFKPGTGGSDSSFVSNCFSVLAFGLMFLNPCAFTILIEWLISLIFRLKAAKVIILTNLCTNLVMNLIISLICGLIPVNYYLVVLIAEVVVMIIEFLVYIKAIKNQPKWKLLIYTIIANIVSWGLYTLTLVLLT